MEMNGQPNDSAILSPRKGYVQIKLLPCLIKFSLEYCIALLALYNCGGCSCISFFPSTETSPKCSAMDGVLVFQFSEIYRSKFMLSNNAIHRYALYILYPVFFRNISYRLIDINWFPHFYLHLPTLFVLLHILVGNSLLRSELRHLS
jgi:hypothetical protein